MRVQACPLPTAILSVHTGFPNHYLDDYTARMRPYMENWAENDLDFDAILTGFLGSEEQIEVVLDAVHTFKGKDTLVIVAGSIPRIRPRSVQRCVSLCRMQTS